MLNFTKKEIALLISLNTPAKVQDFINKIPINFELGGKETLKSPLMVMRTNSAHCFEGALLAAYIFSLHSRQPVILSLNAKKPDSHHVIALFKQQGYWGAVSKTNHAVLRYREPVYKNIRELVISYFHEYFTDKGIKTLEKYSQPFNLNTLKFDWARAEKDLWLIDKILDKLKYYKIAPDNILKNLRTADRLERQVGKLTEYKKSS